MSRFKEYKVVTESVVTKTYYLDAKDQDHAEDLFIECEKDLTPEDEEWSDAELTTVVQTMRW